MMQFNEPLLPPPPPLSNLIMSNKNQIIHRTRPWPGFPTSKNNLGGTNIGAGDANCMEQLLIHCANAIESNDATLAQQILWVLNNIAPPDGDSNQRLTCSFLRALISRAAVSGSCCNLLVSMADVVQSVNAHRFSIIELAGFVDLTPWHRFGFSAANAAVVAAVEGYSVVHIVDISSTHCMQIPTLIDAFSTRPEGPPIIKLTLVAGAEDSPPMLDESYEELGVKLVNFARSRNVALDFRVVPSSPCDGFSALIQQLRIHNLVRPETNEALVINCHMMLHQIPDETLFEDNNNSISSNTPSFRAMFLKSIRSLDPTLVLLVDEDADFTSNNLVCRLRSAFNYLWIPFDTVDTLLPGGSKQREWYEANIWWRVENVIAQEGVRRVERLEPKNRWVQRMRNVGFRGVSFGEDCVSEVKSMLDEHAAGWGLKREDDDVILLTWKGHNVVFASAWRPHC